MTLEISRAFVDAILEQSRVEYPDECCGVTLAQQVRVKLFATNQ